MQCPSKPQKVLHSQKQMTISGYGLLSKARHKWPSRSTHPAPLTSFPILYGWIYIFLCAAVLKCSEQEVSEWSTSSGHPQMSQTLPIFALSASERVIKQAQASEEALYVRSHPPSEQLSLKSNSLQTVWSWLLSFTHSWNVIVVSCVPIHTLDLAHKCVWLKADRCLFANSTT